MAKALGRRKSKSIKNRLFSLLLFIGFITTVFFISLIIIDIKVFPIVLEILENELVSTVNTAISESASEIISDMNLTSSNFYEQSEADSGKINSIAVNTILVNTICNKMAVDISESLNNIGQRQVSIPIGTLSGVKSLSNLGPRYKVTALPMGSATVDYNSSFEAVGINQVNFQIWVKVDTKIKVVNPLQSGEITISRKLPLVNTIINNDIPNVYFNNSK